MSESSLEIERFINERALVSSISCKSFIVTVFGDIVSPHGGWIWLGSLIDSLKPLGFSERLIRTSVFRLVKEDWLQAQKNGRKSYYAFTDTANKHYTKAARRIYAGTTQHSDGSWLIVMPVFVEELKLTELKKQLRWLGFSALSTGAFAHPSIDQDSLKETIKELNLSDSVIIFSSRTFDEASNGVLRKLVDEKWSIQELQQSYKKLIESYQSIYKLIESKNECSYQQSYLLRSLLIHEYRRILLKDHELSENMLPENWSGLEANKLVKAFYAVLAKSSNHYIVSQLETFEGNLPKAELSYSQRFK